ncbi:MAG: BON domain-containing protein [Ktedonobacterales bacterium]|nr:BON domain-containing protein [Ktedonobacterales bacterium]
MHLTTGPARYFFLRQTQGTKEEGVRWPPEIKPLQQPDNWVCVAVYLSAEEHGWRAEAVREEAHLRSEAGGAFVLTRETTLGLSPDGRRSNVALELLGVRVALLAEKGPEYATHLVVRVVGGMGIGLPKHPLVVPVTALVLAGYLEHGDRAEVELDLRLTSGELAGMPPYLPDPVIERAASRALDEVILSERQRHEIKPEVEAGRVTLYGRAELTTSGEVARAELEATPGVIEVMDRLIYGELLMEQVRELLVTKGYENIDIRFENGLIELGGSVPDMATIHKLRDLILRVTGVRGVVTNQLVLEAPAAPPTSEAAAPKPGDGGKATTSATPTPLGETKLSSTTRG